MLDRRYSAEEVAKIASIATEAMGDVPQVVVLAAHAAAASTLLADALQFGPLSLDFQRASAMLNAIADLFLLVCETGPVATGTTQ